MKANIKSESVKTSAELTAAVILRRARIIAKNFDLKLGTKSGRRRYNGKFRVGGKYQFLIFLHSVMQQSTACIDVYAR